MNLYAATATIVLVMDPLGNIPPFLSLMRDIEPKRQKFIIVRECIIAFLIMTLFLFFGDPILQELHISEPALAMSGGIILFLIAVRMIFPSPEAPLVDPKMGEPFIVPLAIPMVAGPSTLATVLLFATQETWPIQAFVALCIASTICTILFLLATNLRRLLGEKGLVALERLMGMILTTIAVQLFLTGMTHYWRTMLVP